MEGAGDWHFPGNQVTSLRAQHIGRAVKEQSQLKFTRPRSCDLNPQICELRGISASRKICKVCCAKYDIKVHITKLFLPVRRTLARPRNGLRAHGLHQWGRILRQCYDSKGQVDFEKFTAKMQ